MNLRDSPVLRRGARGPHRLRRRRQYPGELWLPGLSETRRAAEDNVHRRQGVPTIDWTHLDTERGWWLLIGDNTNWPTEVLDEAMEIIGEVMWYSVTL